MMMVLVRFEMLTLRVIITVFVMTMVLMQIKRWMHGDWFYTTDYGIFGHEVKATERSSPENLTR